MSPPRCVLQGVASEGHFYCVFRAGCRRDPAEDSGSGLGCNEPTCTDKGTIQKPQPSEPGRCREAWRMLADFR